MIAMNGKDWDGDIDIWVFIIDVHDGSIFCGNRLITQDSKLTWLVSQTVESQ